jgi:hypothetical protein
VLGFLLGIAVTMNLTSSQKRELEAAKQLYENESNLFAVQKQRTADLYQRVTRAENRPPILVYPQSRTAAEQLSGGKRSLGHSAEHYWLASGQSKPNSLTIRPAVFSLAQPLTLKPVKHPLPVVELARGPAGIDVPIPTVLLKSEPILAAHPNVTEASPDANPEVTEAIAEADREAKQSISEAKQDVEDAVKEAREVIAQAENEAMLAVNQAAKDANRNALQLIRDKEQCERDRLQADAQARRAKLQAEREARSATSPK